MTLIHYNYRLLMDKILIMMTEMLFLQQVQNRFGHHK